jgi:hypothetical protein
MSSNTTPRPWLLVIVASLLCGCGDQSGSPQPVPIPDPKQFRATGVLPGQPETVTLVGLPSATAGAGEVLVRNITRGGEVRVTASAAGSFWASFTAAAKDQLEVSFAESQPASFEVPEIGVAAPAPPSAIGGIPPVEASAPGQARIRGQVVSGITAVIAVAPRSGDVVISAVDGQRRFDLTLAAASGDPIEVYNEVAVLEGAWSLVVP